MTTDRQADSITTDSIRKRKGKEDRIFNLLASLNLLEIRTMPQTRQPNEREPIMRSAADRNNPRQTHAWHAWTAPVMMWWLVFALGFVLALHAGAQEPPLKLLLDTDIGADIDDEMTLIYLLNSPEIDLRGFTTVQRDPARRAEFARGLIAAMGRGGEIPVYAGAGVPS